MHLIKHEESCGACFPWKFLNFGYKKPATMLKTIIIAMTTDNELTIGL